MLAFIQGLTVMVCGVAISALGALYIGKASRQIQNLDSVVAIMLTATFNTPTLKPDGIPFPITGEPIEVLTVYADGHVVFGPGFTADDAAKAFWKRVEELAPYNK